MTATTNDPGVIDPMADENLGDLGDLSDFLGAMPDDSLDGFIDALQGAVDDHTAKHGHGGPCAPWLDAAVSHRADRKASKDA